MKTDIIFDLDGTLTDSGPGIKNSVRYMAKHYGLPQFPEEEMNRFVGPPLLSSFQTEYGMTEEQAKEAIAVYRTYFREKGMFENSVYPGIRELLTALKDHGCSLYIATGKPTVYSRQILAHFGLDEYFDMVSGVSLSETESGKEELIRLVLTECDVDPANAVMVGDRRFDAEGAAACGIPCIGVTYGYGTKEELLDAGVCALAESVEQLKTILLS